MTDNENTSSIHSGGPGPGSVPQGRERVHHAPFGAVSFFTGSNKAIQQALGPKRAKRGSPLKSDPMAALLALAGQPAEAFCLLPLPEYLIVLDVDWPEPDPAIAVLVHRAIGRAFDCAILGVQWLNRWEDNLPNGLWHWGWRTSEGITPLNCGFMNSRYLWAVFNNGQAVPSMRSARGPMVSTPPGFALASSQCRWTFTERAWSPQDEREVVIYQAVDFSDPFRPYPIR
jgi:hypothetical protein